MPITDFVMAIMVVYPHLRVEAFRSTPDRFEFGRGLYVPSRTEETILASIPKVEMPGMDSCRIDIDPIGGHGPWMGRIFDPSWEALPPRRPRPKASGPPRPRPPLWHDGGLRNNNGIPFPIHQDVVVIPADDPRNLRLGWVIYEEIGVAVINDYATARISLGGDVSVEGRFVNRIWGFYNDVVHPPAGPPIVGHSQIARFRLVGARIEKFRIIRKASDVQDIE